VTGFRQIVEFLESNDFERDLTAGCKKFEILSEADLSVFVCRKLIELFSDTPNLRSKYRVNAQPFCGELKFYPDIAIFRRHPKGPDEPAIAIELKEGHSFGNAIEHDCRKLWQYRDSISVRRAYLIHVVHSAGSVKFQQVLSVQKRGLKNIKGICVVMRDKLGDDYPDWHERRRKLATAFKAKLAKTASAS
jgi:hypothetical protein